MARPTSEARHSQAVQSLIGSFLDGLLLQPGPQLPPDLQETKGLKKKHFSVGETAEKMFRTPIWGTYAHLYTQI